MTQSVDALLVTAEEALRAGDIRTTANLGQQVLLRDGNNADAYLLMGKVAFTLKKMDSALRYIEKAIGCRPDIPTHYEWKGRVLATMERFKEASTAYEWAARILCQESFHSVSPSVATTVCGYIEEAITHNPERIELFYLLGDVYLQSHAVGKAVYCFQQVLQRLPENINAIMGMAQASAAMHYHKEALRYTDLALEKGAGLSAYLMKAQLLEHMNLLEECYQVLTEVRQRFPGRLEWLLPVAKLAHRNGRPQEALPLLERLLASNTPLSEDPWLWYELARVLGKLGRYDEAFTWFCKVNQHVAGRAAQLRANSRALDALLERSLHYYSGKQAVAAAPAPSNTAPIFLVGFPRSGTTLMEQMLAAHSGITTTQETGIIEDLVRELSDIVGRECAYPEGLATLNADETMKLQESYWQRIIKLFGEEARAKRLVHKMPLDMKMLDMIQLLFPAAPILVMIRDPRDTVLSCFQQLFKLNAATLYFTDLQQSAFLYQKVMTLYTLYRQSLPLVLQEIRYETLVAQPEQQLRKILAFIGMPWEDSVLDYYAAHRNRLVITPSYEGVMKPIYSDAIGRWRHYAKQMAAVLPMLEPWVARLGYSN